MTAVDGGNSSTAVSKPRVLFVDDEPAMLESLRRAVRREFVADVAIDADHGLDCLRLRGPYSVVVSDMRMPGMDGVEFLATVRTVSPESVRVMLTGCDEIDVAVRAVNDGCILKFLNKPVPTEVLLECLRTCSLHYLEEHDQKQAMATTIHALEQLDIATLTAFARAIDANSPWTAGHSERVTAMALTRWDCRLRTCRLCIGAACCTTSARLVRPPPSWTSRADWKSGKPKSCRTT